MKIIFFFLFVSIFSSQTKLYSQSWQYCNAYSPSNPHDGLLIGDSLFIVNIQDHRIMCSASKTTRAFGPNGKVIWNHPGGTAIAFQDSIIYVAGFYDIADCVTDNHFYIIQYSLEGAALNYFRYPSLGEFREPIEESNMHYYQQPHTIDISPAGKMLVCSPDYFLVLNDSGKAEFAKSYLSDTLLLGAHVLNDNSAYQVTSEGITLIETANGKEMRKFVPDFEIDNYVVAYPHFFIRHLNNIYITDSLVTSFSDTLSIAKSIEVTDFKVYGNRIAVWGKQDNEEVLHIINRENQTKTETHAVYYEPLQSVYDFYLNHDKIFLSGTSPLMQASVLIFVYEKKPEFDFLDIALRDVQITDIDYRYYSTMDNQDSVVIGCNFDTDLTIENTGNAVIDSVSIYTLLNGGFNCSRNDRLWKERGLNLLPGDTKTIHAFRFYQETPFENACFSLLAPNDLIELNIDDNFHCGDFPVAVPRIKKEIEFRFYPNPANNEIQLVFQNEEQREVVIYDSMGNTCISVTTNTPENTINIQELSRGLYFLVVIGKDQTVVKKILVQ